MIYEEMFTLLVFSFLVLVIFFILIELSKDRKSKVYRKQITDMYVASKTRQLAERDKLNIPLEEERFKGWLKKERVNEKGYELDDEIEEDLKDRIKEPLKNDLKDKKK